jgi:hypothetical protein
MNLIVWMRNALENSAAIKKKPVIPGTDNASLGTFFQVRVRLKPFPCLFLSWSKNQFAHEHDSFLHANFPFVTAGYANISFKILS